LVVVIVSGALVSWLTFPGVVVHELAHKKLCDWSGLRVYSATYQPFLGFPHVEHDRPRQLTTLFAVSGAPFFINTILSIAAYGFSLWLFFQQPITNAGWGSQNPKVYAGILMLWFGFSVGVHAIPSLDDVNNIWRGVRENWRESFFALLLAPIVIILYFMSWGKVLWADFIYSALLAGSAFVALSLIPKFVEVNVYINF